MIVPMKKFYLIALDKDRPTLPERLRKLGVAHVEELSGSGETYQNLERERAEIESVYFLLRNYVEKSRSPFLLKLRPWTSLTKSKLSCGKSRA